MVMDDGTFLMGEMFLEDDTELLLEAIGLCSEVIMRLLLGRDDEQLLDAKL